MKLNENAILEMTATLTDGNTVPYDAFDKLFSFLSGDERDAVADVLAAHGINLVDADDDMARAYAAEFTVDGTVFGGNDPLVFAGAMKKNGGRMNELLAKAAQEGSREALDQLFRDNDRLVWDVVRRYTGKYGNCLTEDDLFQAGACGMMKAVEMFRYDLGYKFSTYALWWIRQAVIREIENYGYTIRIPVHKQEQVRQVMRIYNELYYKGVPAADRIPAVVKALAETGNPITEDQAIECVQLREHVMGCTSLDMPIGEDGDAILGDFIPAEREANPETLLEEICLKNDISDVLSTLLPREEKVIRMRFGLDDGCERTLEEVGKAFNVTRERIRQIEAKALRKLRHSSRSKMLKDWVEAA